MATGHWPFAILEHWPLAIVVDLTTGSNRGQTRRGEIDPADSVAYLAAECIVEH